MKMTAKVKRKNAFPCSGMISCCFLRNKKPPSSMNRKGVLSQLIGSDLFSFYPCLMIESADRGYNGQKEEAQHKIGLRSKPLIQ